MHLNSLCMTATGEVFASVQQVTLAIVQCITTACLNRIRWCKWVSSICIVLNLLVSQWTYFLSFLLLAYMRLSNHESNMTRNRSSNPYTYSCTYTRTQRNWLKLKLDKSSKALFIFQIKKEEPVKSAILPYSRPLPCLCIEVNQSWF